MGLWLLRRRRCNLAERDSRVRAVQIPPATNPSSQKAIQSRCDIQRKHFDGTPSRVKPDLVRGAALRRVFSFCLAAGRLKLVRARPLSLFPEAVRKSTRRRKGAQEHSRSSERESGKAAAAAVAADLFFQLCAIHCGYEE